jgi:Flp pilus assembly protein TadD
MMEAAGRTSEAVALARQLAEDYPDDFPPLLSLGRDLQDLKDLPEAEKALRRALRLAPDNVKVHYELARVCLAKGEALLRQGDPAGARGLFREAAERAGRAVALQPDFGPGHVVRGVALGHLGERAAGVEALRQAGRCSPESASFHYLLGKALAEEGLGDEARRQLEWAVEFGTPADRWRDDAVGRLKALKK